MKIGIDFDNMIIWWWCF